MNEFCENYSTDKLFDWSEDDFAGLCTEELLLFGLPFVYIVICGSIHLNTILKVKERTQYQLEPAEFIIYGLSLLQIVAPIIRLAHSLVTSNFRVGGFEFVSTFFRLTGWFYSTIILRKEMSRLLCAPSYTLYGWWLMSFVGTAFRFRTAVRISLEIEIDLPQLLWYIQFGMTCVLTFVAIFMKRHDDTEIDPTDTLSERLWRATHRGRAQSDAQRVRLLTMENDTNGVKPLHDVADAESDVESDHEVQPNKERYASLFSVLTFNFMTRVLKAGYNHQLLMKDIHDIQHFDKADENCEKMEEIWKKQRLLPESDSIPTLVSTLWKVYKKPFLQHGATKIVADCLQFASPQILKLLLAFVGDPNQPAWHGYFYTAMLFLAAVGQTIFVHQYYHRGFRIGMWIKASLTSMIYKKSLRLSGSARQSQTAGSIVNLMSTDTQRIQDLLPLIHNLWFGPIIITIAIVFLWIELQYAALVGVGVMFVFMLPVNYVLVKIQRRVQVNMMDVKDERVKVTNEVLSSMKIIKLYAWENEFQEKVKGIRDEEIVHLRLFSILDGITRALSVLLPVLVGTVTFVSYSLMGYALTPSKAFTSLVLFNIIRFPLRQYPQVVNSIIETIVSIDRVTNFFDMDEINSKQSHFEPDEKEGVVAIIENGNFFWDSKQKEKALTDIDVRIKTGELRMIVGKTGSGKSALLYSLIGDMSSSPETRLGIFGDVAYTAQVAWIQNATLRDNILFGSPYSKSWYDKVVYACALEPDLEMLVSGDLTEIGEKGINLSGGQKQRIALARAVYRNCAVYILDDCLSAVDAHVGQHIMKHCIMGVLQNKTRIFATNSINFLKHADNILVLERGTIADRGSYSDLVARGIDLVKLLHVEEEEKAQDVVNDVPDSSKGNSAEGYIPRGLRPKPEPPKGKPPKRRRRSVAPVGSNKMLQKGKLISEEIREEGAVSSAVYWAYIKSGGGICILIAVVLPNLCKQGFDLGASMWLGAWTDQNVDGRSSRESTNIEIYCALTFGVFISMISFIYAWVVSRIRASRNLHESCIHSVLRAPMAFYDTTPIGRILNRFSSDLYTVDARLPWVIFSYLVVASNVLGTIVIISVITPLFVVVLFFICIFYYYAQEYYIRTSRELKRWASVLQSPIYSHFGETLDGVSTIRAFKVENRFTLENQQVIDQYTTAFYAGQLTNRWLAVRLEFVGSLVVVTAAIMAVVGRDNLSGGMAGISITYALKITGSLNWVVRMVAERETNIVSVERIDEYSQTPSEAALRIEGCVDDPNWPRLGAITFNNLEMRYRPGLDLVLKGISFNINPKEKIGIVGRTGSGKSSTLVALLRIVEASGGAIVIDGVDISKVGLHDLRKKLSIIPQDSVLFTGSIRFNLDPFQQSSDEEMWTALRLSHLEEHVRSLQNQDLDSVSSGLDYEVSEGGANFSAGQRQLLCLARCLLRKTRILLLDEATSAVDVMTDRLVQQTIREAFRDYTVITIAHRLDTIMDSDRILVMENGEILEFDSPHNLLQNSQSSFFRIAVSAFGETAVNNLAKIQD